MSIFSRVAPYFLLSLAALCLACIVSVIVLGALEWQRAEQAKVAGESVSTINSLRPESYQESVVITSVNVVEKKIIAQVRSSTAGQFIPTILRYTDELEVVRRDVVIENGVIVDLTDTTPATIADLTAGTNGIATIYVSNDGDMFLLRIIIGDPLPRP